MLNLFQHTTGQVINALTYKMFTCVVGSRNKFGMTPGLFELICSVW